MASNQLFIPALTGSRCVVLQKTPDKYKHSPEALHMVTTVLFTFFFEALGMSRSWNIRSKSIQPSPLVSDEMRNTILPQSTVYK